MGGDINEAVDDGKTTAGPRDSPYFLFCQQLRLDDRFFFFFFTLLPSIRQTPEERVGVSGGCRVHRQYAALTRQTTHHQTDVQSY